MQLKNVVPFGRSLDEYCQMFNLNSDDLTLKILGVADGPASFNAELSAKGGHIISIDPIYAFQAKQIQERFNLVVDDIIEQVKSTPNDWVWSYHKDPETLRQNRINVIKAFIKDYAKSFNTQRYINASVPHLPFADHEFDLALCSHFLFLYSEQFSYKFHEQSIMEMLRVANEVRIFPLLTLMREKSPYLHQLIQRLTEFGYDATIQKVKYELQKGGNEMLIIKKVNV